MVTTRRRCSVLNRLGRPTIRILS